MKSDSCKSFWRWFSSAAESLAKAPPGADLLDELDRRVRELHPGLSWEIGPGRGAEMSLTISPDLNAGLVPLTREIVSQAPAIPGWEIYGQRQPKQWARRFELRRDSLAVPIDASAWQFVLLRYEDDVVEIAFYASALHGLTEQERQQAALIVAEAELGEEWLLDPNLCVGLLDEMEEHQRKKLRPLEQLKSAFGLPFRPAL